MFFTKQLVCLTFLSFFQQLCVVEGESKVDCNFNESCTLPCSFQTGKNLLIRWKINDKTVLSYNEDKVDVENHFRGRAWLSGEISKGNASLRLDPLKIQDEGRYECYISVTEASKSFYMELRVNALPRRVNIQREGDKISCNAEGIYPRPHLAWSSSSSPALNVTEEPRVLQTEQQLYNISSVMEPGDESVDYSCTVSARQNKRRATLFRATSLNGSSSETKILCNQNPSNASQTGLTWRFNHSQIILIQTTADAPHSYSEEWEKHVKKTGTRDLVLENLSSDHDGVYTCELSTAEEDCITNTELKVTTDSSHKVGAIVGGALAAVLLVLGIGAVYFWQRRRGNNIPPAANNREYQAANTEETNNHDTRL